MSLTRSEIAERLKRIIARIDEIDRLLLDLCPGLDRAAKLNNERVKLAREAREINDGGPEA